MRYLGASVALVVAAMTFSLTPLGGTARAVEDKPIVGSIIGRNAIPAAFREFFQHKCNRHRKVRR